MTCDTPGFPGMRMKTALVAGATGFLAAAGAVVGFQQIAPAADTVTTTTAAPAPVAARPAPTEQQKPRLEVRYRPCPKDFTLKGKECVRDVVQTRVVNVPAPASPPAPVPVQPVQPATRSVSGSGGSVQGVGVDGGEGYGDDGSQYESEDHVGEREGIDGGQEPGDDGGHADEPEDD